MEFYLNEKQKKKRLRILKLKIYGGIAAFFVLLIGIGYLIIYSPLFQVKNIEVNGNKEVKAQDIIDAVEKTMMNQSKIASFLTAKNILIWRTDFNLDGENNPQIAEIKIDKDYFRRLIKITVKEQEKFGVWCQQQPTGSDCWWFDKNGILFKEAPIIEGNLINKVDDFSGRAFKIGDAVLEEKLLSNLIKIFEILKESNLGIKSLKLENLALQEIVSEPLSNSLPKIYFSLRLNPAFTLTAIQSLKEIGLTKIEYIDFRVKNRVYYKIK